MGLYCSAGQVCNFRLPNLVRNFELTSLDLGLRCLAAVHWRSCTEVCIWNFSFAGPKVYSFTTLGAFSWCRHLLELATQFPEIDTTRLQTTQTIDPNEKVQLRLLELQLRTFDLVSAKVP